MTAVTVRPASKPLATTASAECSKALWQRLTEREAHAYDAAALIATTPELREEAVRVLAAMEAHAAPCGAKAVIAELAPMVALYGVPDRSREEWATFWRFYTDLLGKLSLEAVKAGVAAYVAKPDAEFFPKPGPLAALCKETHDRLFMAAHRLRIACAAKQPEEVGARDPDAYRRHLSEVSLAIWTERKEQAA